MRQPVKIINQLPADFDLHPMPKASKPWAFVSFMGAIAILLGALVTGEWN